MTADADNASKNAIMAVRILDELFGEVGDRGVGVRLWDGTNWPDEKPRPATLVLKHPDALSSMFRAGTELALAEAYLYDDFDIVGDFESVFDLNDVLAAATSGWRKKLRAARILAQLPHPHGHSHGRRGPARLTGKQHSTERDSQAVTYHYDVSNDFYALWLDRNMVYSCAYFRSEDEELDPAQERKLDYACRKLRLRAGQRLLDLGCGWGGLVLHAARHYGVDATGITLSKSQAELANARIAEAGLAEHARVHVRDYRGVSSGDAEIYDALVSVGMFEHIGAVNLPSYFAQASRLLKPRGVFLNHGIACRANAPTTGGPSFIDTYVFPDGELTSMSTTLGAAQAANFEIRDVESLREHYALTLRHWVRRLESHHELALHHVDEPTYRVWRLYMSGSAHGFSTGRLNVYQVLLVKPDERGQSGLPLTRIDWYAPSHQIFDPSSGPAANVSVENANRIET